jgi:hypothetical protein
MRSKPENGSERTPWIPASGSGSTGLFGTVRTMTGTPSSASTDRRDEARPLEPALQEPIDEHDVGSELLDRPECSGAIVEDVEQLHPV